MQVQEGQRFDVLQMTANSNLVGRVIAVVVVVTAAVHSRSSRSPSRMLLQAEVQTGRVRLPASHDRGRWATRSYRDVVGLTSQGRPRGRPPREPMSQSKPYSARHQDRLALGAAAVVTVATATSLLPLGDKEARTWLRDRGLVRDLLGRQVVVWGDVLDALKGDDGGPTEERPPRVALPRTRLEPVR